MHKFSKLNLSSARKFLSSVSTSSIRILNLYTKPQKNFSINRFKFNKKSFSTNENNNKPEKKLNLYQSAKMKIKQYGTRGVIFYCVMYFANGLMFYFLFKYQIIKSEKFLTKFNELGLDKYINTERIINMVGKNNLDIFCAIISNELFEIVRVPLVIMLIPKIFRKMK